MTDDLISSSGSEEPKQEQSNYIEELVGEGKKYATIEDLAKGTVHAQNHISNLEQENKALRYEKGELTERMGSSKTIEDIISRLPQNNTDSATENQSEPQTPDVEQAVRKALQEERQLTQLEMNRKNVSKALLDAFEGDRDRAIAHRDSRLKEVGLTPEQFVGLSESSPKAAAELLIKKQSQQHSTIAHRGNDGSNPQSNVRNKAYYDELRKEMGRTKFNNDIELQARMLADATSLGDEWKA